MKDFEVLGMDETEATEATTDVVEVEGGRVIFEPGQSDDTSIKLDIPTDDKKTFDLKSFVEGTLVAGAVAGLAIGIKKTVDLVKNGKEKKAKKKQEEEEFKKWRAAQQAKENSDAVDVNYEDVEAEASESEAKEPEKTEPEKEKEQPKEDNKKKK